MSPGKHKRKRRRSSAGAESGEDSDGEAVPNFPQAAVVEGETKDGDEPPVAVVPLQKGDVVWGKVMGFPWWPGTRYV